MTETTAGRRIQLSLILPPALQGLPPTDLATWATNVGFGAINAELDFDGATVAAFAAADLGLGPLRIKASLADSDRATRLAAAEAFCAGIDRTVALGLDTVWTVPRNFRNDATPRGNFAALRETLPPVVAHAERRGVRIAIENCPFEGENVICTPEAWDAFFALLPSPNLGLCLDPSHCVWLGIDYLRVVRDYAPRLFHLHAKDAELLPEGQYRYGTLGPQLTELGLEDIWPRHGW